MTTIRITVIVDRRDRLSGATSDRVATWVGDPGWLSLPRQGDPWGHCPDGEDGAVAIRRVWWNGPGADIAHDVEAIVDVDLFDHLIAEHGFVESTVG